mmetsp:Transcript_54445/g.124046  ORF Transcript_54445/g.124046 Transcript_54445/m.124046 type:complete len:152 (+) Transcript_54445:258-713(+)
MTPINLACRWHLCVLQRSQTLTWSTWQCTKRNFSSSTPPWKRRYKIWAVQWAKGWERFGRNLKLCGVAKATAKVKALGAVLRGWCILLECGQITPVFGASPSAALQGWRNPDLRAPCWIHSASFYLVVAVARLWHIKALGACLGDEADGSC